MILDVVSALLLLALLLLLSRRRRSGLTALALGLLVLLAFASGPLTRVMLTHLQRSYVSTVSPGAWSGRDAIVVLGAGTVHVASTGEVEPPMVAYGRLVRAAELYRRCKQAGGQCLVVVSGGNPQHHEAAEAVIYARELRALGIQDVDLALEMRSNSTWQNAQFSRPMLKAWAPRRIWLLTSGFHMRRALLYFAHFGIHPVPVRGDYLYALVTWWPVAWNVSAADTALHEYLGIARFYVYEAMGWNAPAAGPLICSGDGSEPAPPHTQPAATRSTRSD